MKIPKIFHRIWLGSKPMPENFVRWGKTWLEQHPDWHMLEWNENNLPETRYPELIKKCCHLSQQSNIYRYEILLRFGGVYIDTDFECNRNIEEILKHVEAFSCHKFSPEKRHVCPGILGGVGGHPLFETLVRNIPTRDVEKSLSLGSSYLSYWICQHPNVTIFPREYFYPYSCSEMYNYQPNPASMYPNAYGIHHWSSKWFPAGFERINT